MAITVKTMVAQLVKKYPDKHIIIRYNSAYYPPDNFKTGYSFYIEDIVSRQNEYLTYEELRDAI